MQLLFSYPCITHKNIAAVRVPRAAQTGHKYNKNDVIMLPQSTKGSTSRILKRVITISPFEGGDQLNCNWMSLTLDINWCDWFDNIYLYTPSDHCASIKYHLRMFAVRVSELGQIYWIFQIYRHILTWTTRGTATKVEDENGQCQ